MTLTFYWDTVVCWLQTNGTWADWALAMGTILLVVVASVAACIAKKQLGKLKDSSDIQLFSRLLEEIAELEASHDRGLVREKIPENAKTDCLKNYVDMGRRLSEEMRFARLKQRKPGWITTEALIGNAIEWTIVRYDRVAFLIFSTGW